MLNLPVTWTSDLDQVSRAAGSHEDAQLADTIFRLFQGQQMDPWTDIHYVQLPTQDGYKHTLRYATREANVANANPDEVTLIMYKHGLIG